MLIKPCLRFAAVLKAPKPSPVKSDSSSIFHNEAQAGINVRKYCEVRHLGHTRVKGCIARLWPVGRPTVNN